MERKRKDSNYSGWAVGGGVMLGIGVGFFFVQISPLFFAGSLMAGLGTGLMAEAFLAAFGKPKGNQ